MRSQRRDAPSTLPSRSRLGLDATNIVNAPVALITPIGVDPRIISGTHRGIAAEKAGIITSRRRPVPTRHPSR